MAIYFISDIHLNPDQPDLYLQFEEFLQSIRNDARQLYILGDLFDYWIGDDGTELLGHQKAVHLLKETSRNGIELFIMHGNRDFLIGEQFADAVGATLISDPHLIEINSQPTLLMHGDSLCTDDVAHQHYRRTVLSPKWQINTLQLPLQERLNRAMALRGLSQSNKSEMSAELMDVNPDAVAEAILKANARLLIHGHVHKPGIHQHAVGGSQRDRYVLGDWGGTTEGVIRADQRGVKLHCTTRLISA